MHSLLKAFRRADHKRVHSPRAHVNEPAAFSLLGPNSFNTVRRQLTLTRGPDCTDSESSFDPRLNLLCTWWEWTLNRLETLESFVAAVDSSHFVERHIFVGGGTPDGDNVFGTAGPHHEPSVCVCVCVCVCAFPTRAKHKKYFKECVAGQVV